MDIPFQPVCAETPDVPTRTFGRRPNLLWERSHVEYHECNAAETLCQCFLGQHAQDALPPAAIRHRKYPRLVMNRGCMLGCRRGTCVRIRGATTKLLAPLPQTPVILSSAKNPPAKPAIHTKRSSRLVRFAKGSPAKGPLMGDAGGIERMRPFCFSAIASAGPQAKGRSAFRAWRSPRKRQRALAFAQNEDGLTAVVASSGLVPKKNPGHEARGYQFGRSCRNRRAGVARSGSSRGHPCNDWRRPTGVATGVAAGDAEGVAPSGASITNGSLNAEYSQTM
jgi:hypothetical protein